MTKLTLHEFDAVAFDAEGTLFDTFPLHHAARYKAFADHGFGYISKEEHAKGATYGSSTLDILGGILYAAGAIKDRDYADNPVLRAVVAARDTYFNELVHTHGYNEIPGATDFFKHVARHFKDKTALVTAAPWHTLAAAVTRYGLDAHLTPECTITGDTVTQLGLSPKPAPDSYVLAGTRMNANKLLVFEDTAPGVAAAKQAGATVVAVCSDEPSWQQFTSGDIPHAPDYLVQNYREAGQLIGVY